MEKINVAERPQIDTAAAWQAYWEKTAKLSTPILWNTPSEIASERDLPRFQHLMNPELPLIDFACGHGNQAYFLAQHFPRVMGVDVSASAIELAQAQYGAPNIEYRVLDALKPEQAAALHAEIGDSNIYMRTGFHHICPEKRDTFAQSLHTLLGKQGILYLFELGDGGDEYVGSMVDRYEVQLVVQHGLRPGAITQQEVARYFADYEVLDSGKDTLQPVVRFENGEAAQIPAFYAVLRRK
ncbi:MAG: methyltransferase domain-containing protein [Leptolyngbya sp. Prado105]|jgi:cyclopropane fatty-acyl-phospholipid synthase-like methyltransferase|nr:methyltransferase domain-containing protein [Leptolyngbya sp. Prado105]